MSSNSPPWSCLKCATTLPTSSPPWVRELNCLLHVQYSVLPLRHPALTLVAYPPPPPYDEHLIHSQRYPRLQDHSVDVNHPRGELHRVPRGPCFCRLQPRISAGCNHSSSHGICDGFSHPHYRGTSRIIKVVAGVKIQWVRARSFSHN